MDKDDYLSVPNGERPQGYWPNLNKATVKKNKDFAKRLFDFNFKGNLHWFDSLASPQREENKNMTLDLFLEHSDKNSNYTLHMQHADLLPEYSNKIYVNSLCYSDVIVPKHNGLQFFWLIIPWTPKNYSDMNSIFKDIYKTDIASYPRRGE